MSGFYDRLIHRLLCALEINDYYWMHTDSDDGERIRVENLQRAVRELCGKLVEKYLLDEDSDLERSNCIRYEDGSLIIVTAEEDERWIRYSTVKELCHVYCDSGDELQPDAKKSLISLLPAHAESVEQFFVGQQPNQQAEKVAEIMAVELLYPAEFRRVDIERLKNGVSVREISHQRGVPEKFVESYLEERFHNSLKSALDLAVKVRLAQK